MKVLLLNIDSKLPNIALNKVAMYYQNENVVWDNWLEMPYADKVFASCIFQEKESSEKVEQVKGLRPDAVVGGTGYDYTIKLPPEIDAMKPKLNYGFTTRGCIRRCKFCFVPKSEGAIRVTGDIYDIWDGVSKEITLLDNNILALPEHFAMICEQIRKEKLTVDFNQGLDHRLLTEPIIQDMKSIRHKEYRFAFDHISYRPTVERAINLLQAHGINRCSWYVLVGFDSTFHEDLERLNILREHNQIAYVQRYSNSPRLVALARWANQHHIYRGMTWEQFLSHKDNKRYRYLQEAQNV